MIKQNIKVLAVVLLGFALPYIVFAGPQNWTQVDNPTSLTDNPFSIAIDDSALYAVGYEGFNGSYSKWHIEKRSLDTGVLIGAFGTNGIVTSDPSPYVDMASDAVTDDTYLYIVGTDSGTTGATEWHIEKRNKTTGSLVWSKSYLPGSIMPGATINGDARAVAVDTTGVYISGRAGSGTHVEKISLDGSTVMWGRDVTTIAWQEYGDVLAMKVSGGIVTFIENINGAIFEENLDSTSGALISKKSVTPPASRREKVDSAGSKYYADFDYILSGSSDSAWRISKTVNTDRRINHAPPPPTITEASGNSRKPGEVQTYSFISIDPDGDDIKNYSVDWGDGSAKVNSGLKSKGVAFTTTHTYAVKGSYTIKANASDVPAK